MSAETSLHQHEVRAPEVIDSGEILRRQSSEVQKIVQDDPRLRDHLSKITNLEEFFRALEAEKHIFLQRDNTLAQETFLGQSIKGLGYGQMTSDGRDFSVLTEKEVDGLADAEYDKYQKWKMTQTKATIIAEKKGLEGDKTRVIGVKEERKDVQATLIELDSKLGPLKNAVEGVNKNISQDGKNIIETKFQEAKTDSQSPAVDALIKSGVSSEEIRSTNKYDNYIRASVILGAEAELAKYAIDADTFSRSLSDIRKLGIVPSRVDIANVTSHIDARFPKSSATETAKSEISRSIASGSIASISYDGRGEKYTLMDRDGQTSKEVYMSPPRVRVMRSGLTIEQSLPEKKDEDKRIDIQSKLRDASGKSGESIRVFTRDMSERTIMNEEHVALVSTETYKSSYMTLLSSAPIEKRRESAEKLRSLYMSARDTYTPNKDIYDRKYSELGDIIQRLDKHAEAEKNARNLPTRTSLPMERFDTIASTNLSWLVESRFDRVGPRANEVLTRMLGEINTGRTPANQISLEGRILDTSEKDALLGALQKIGGTPDALTDADKISLFRRNIQTQLTLPPSESGSIESTLRGR